MANIILNGDILDCCSNPTTGYNGKPIHWGMYGSFTNSILNWGSDSTDFVSSPYSIYFDAKAYDSGTISMINTGLIAGDSNLFDLGLNAYTVFGGQTYHIEFDIKHSFNKISIEVVSWDISGLRKFNAVYLDSTSNTTVLSTNGLWEHHTSDFIMPTNAVKAVMLFRDDESFTLGTIYSGTCHLDNIIMDTSYLPPPCSVSTVFFTTTVVNNTASFDSTGSNGGTSSDDIVHPIIQYNWTFGDGSTGTGNKTIHQYTQDGIYLVELKIKNDCEISQVSTSNFVTITGTPPPPPPSTENNTMLYVVIAGIAGLGLIYVMSKRK